MTKRLIERTKGPRRSGTRLMEDLLGMACGGLAFVLAGCAHALPDIAGRSSAPPAPSEAWRPPPGTVPPEPVASTAGVLAAVPAELVSRITRFTLTDVVDVALRNNPLSQQSWAQARAAAALYGAASGAYLPTIDASANIGRTQSSFSTGLSKRTQISPTISLSYLLLDFGGRSGTVTAARENVIALDLTHNATLQNVVLQVENAYFGYMATRALLAAQQQTVAEEQANLTAAQRRHDAGLATIADVLQAQTLLAQVQLDLETIQGNLQATRGSLAVAMGLPANAPYDVAAAPDSIPVGLAQASVDTLISRAVASRPDLAAARVDVLQSQAQVRATRSQQLPSLTLGASTAKTYSDVNAFQGINYAVTLGIQLPLFNGFSRQYNLAAAEAQVDASLARAALLRSQVANEVFTSYYALQTATQRVRTADVLLASATQSEGVARGRYTQGVGTILDLITAQTALANARAQQAQTRWTWASSLAQLAHDVGVLGLRGEVPIPLVRDSTGIRR